MPQLPVERDATSPAGFAARIAARATLLRVLGSVAVVGLAWLAGGSKGVVWCAPALGGLLARPILDAGIGSYRAMRRRLYQDVNGLHYAYRGTSISVTQDGEGWRWLRLADVRKVLPALARDESLSRILGPEVAPMAPDRALRIRAGALADYLGRTSSPGTAKFARWVEHTIDAPSPARRAQRDAVGARSASPPSDTGTCGK